MTLSQSTIFNQVKEFVHESRSTLSSKLTGAELSMPNTFSAGERAFLISLAHDLHLRLSWDEYDKEDQNLAVLRFLGASESLLDCQDSESDSQDQEDTIAAVDLVMKTYNEAEIFVETSENNFESREEARLELEVDDWKRVYYKV